MAPNPNPLIATNGGRLYGGTLGIGTVTTPPGFPTTTGTTGGFVGSSGGSVGLIGGPGGFGGSVGSSSGSSSGSSGGSGGSPGITGGFGSSGDGSTHCPADGLDGQRCQDPTAIHRFRQERGWI